MSEKPVKLLTLAELDDLAAGSRKWRASTYGPPITWGTFDQLIDTAREAVNAPTGCQPFIENEQYRDLRAAVDRRTRILADIQEFDGDKRGMFEVLDDVEKSIPPLAASYISSCIVAARASGDATGIQALEGRVAALREVLRRMTDATREIVNGSPHTDEAIHYLHEEIFDAADALLAERSEAITQPDATPTPTRDAEIESLRGRVAALREYCEHRYDCAWLLWEANQEFARNNPRLVHNIVLGAPRPDCTCGLDALLTGDAKPQKRVSFDVIERQRRPMEVTDETLQAGASRETAGPTDADAPLEREVIRYTGMVRDSLVSAVESQGVARWECERWDECRLRDHLVTCAVVRHLQASRSGAGSGGSENLSAGAPDGAELLDEAMGDLEWFEREHVTMGGDTCDADAVAGLLLRVHGNLRDLRALLVERSETTKSHSPSHSPTPTVSPVGDQETPRCPTCHAKSSFAGCSDPFHDVSETAGHSASGSSE